MRAILTSFRYCFQLNLSLHSALDAKLLEENTPFVAFSVRVITA
jgi:hypothetical protein